MIVNVLMERTQKKKDGAVGKRTILAGCLPAIPTAVANPNGKK